MIRLLTTAACCGALFAGNAVSAQGIVGNTISRAGDVISGTVDRADDTVRNLGTGRAMDRGHVHASSEVQLQPTQDPGWNQGYQYGSQPYQGHVDQGYARGSYGHQRGYHPSGYRYGQSARMHGHRGHRGHHSHHGYTAQPMDGYSGQVYSGQAYGGQVYSGYLASANTVYTLQHDASGREFICVNGQRVYFDNVGGQAGSFQDDRYQSAYGSYDQASGAELQESDEGTPMEAPTLKDADSADQQQENLDDQNSQSETEDAAENAADDSVSL